MPPVMHRVARATTLLAVLCLALLGLQLLDTPGADAATPVTVTGRVTIAQTNQQTVAGTAVQARSTVDGSVLATTTVAADGSYSLTVTADAVDVVVTPPNNSGYGPTTVAGVDTTHDTVVNVTLVASDRTNVSGTVTDAGGTPLRSIYVQITFNNGTQYGGYTAADGTYSVAARPGTGTLLVVGCEFCSTHGAFRLEAPITLSGPERQLDVTLPLHTVTVQARDDQGQPVVGATVSIPYVVKNQPNQQLEIAPGVTTQLIVSFQYAPHLVTDATGSVQMSVLDGTGALTGSVDPAAGDHLREAALSVPDTDVDTTVVVTLPAIPYVTLSGTVIDQLGTPLAGARIATQNAAGGAETVTASDGTFSLASPSGAATRLTIDGCASCSTGSVGVFSVATTLDLTSDQTHQLTIPLHHVSFHVRDSGSSGVPQAVVEATGGYDDAAADQIELAPGLVSTSLGQGFTNLTTDEHGTASTAVLDGLPITTLTLPPAATHLQRANTSFPAGAADRDVTIDLESLPFATLSGTVIDQDGAPVAGSTVSLWNSDGSGSMRTGLDGSFAVTVPAGTQTNLYVGDNCTDACDHTPAVFGVSSVIDLSHDTTLDLTIPLQTLTIRVIGASGHPIPSAGLSAYGQSSSAPDDQILLAPGVRSTYLASLGTGAYYRTTNGVLRARVLTGTQGFVYVNAPADLGLPQAYGSFGPVRGDETEVITFAQSTLDPTPPVVTCDSFAPGWHATNQTVHCTASDAGTGLREASDASFDLTTTVADGATDPNASAGPRQVCDLADNCTTALVTGAQVDRGLPTVTFDPSAATTVVQGAAASTSYSCSDAGSGVASCHGDVASGAALDTSVVGDHTVTVTATDLAGNQQTGTWTYHVTAAPDPGTGGGTGGGTTPTTPTDNGAGQDDVNDHLDYQRAQVYLGIPAGQTASGTVSCPSGYLLTDADPLLQHVDQGEDDRDVHVVSMTRGGTSAMTIRVRNATGGQAHLQLMATCLRQTTGSGGELHVVATPDAAVTTGSATVTCPAGSIGLAPAFDVQHGTVTGMTPDATAGSWSFSTTPSATGTVGVACLSTRTSPTAHLALTSATGSVSGGDRPTSETSSLPSGWSAVALGWQSTGGHYLGHELQDRQVVTWAAHGGATYTVLAVRGWTAALSAGRATLDPRSHRLSALVTCRADCHGTVTLTATRAGTTTTLGRARFDARPGRARSVVVTVPARYRGLVRADGVRLQLSLRGHRTGLRLRS